MGKVSRALYWVERLLEEYPDKRADAATVAGVRLWAMGRRGDDDYDDTRDAVDEVVDELGLAATVHANGNETYSYPLQMHTLFRLARLNLEARARRAKRD